MVRPKSDVPFDRLRRRQMHTEIHCIKARVFLTLWRRSIDRTSKGKASKMRTVLPNEKLTPAALKSIEEFHPQFVEEVKNAVAANKIVVVGMKQNPVVKKARAVLDEKGLVYTYLEYGSYLSMWKQRLAIKIWSGWPTYPQVFIDGKLVGGCKELIAHLRDN